MARRGANLARAVALASIVTVAIALPVLRAPSQRVFGLDIVGRHHDPFTMMQMFTHSVALNLYSQPVTDLSGAALTHFGGPVAAYNWLVLLSFPLSALTAFLLARHVGLGQTAATVSALAFAFSPFHLAQAAYHPHIAQTQWLPLYLLALWRCLDDASPWAVAFLLASTAAVTLSNFYAGLIAAALTPIAVGAYWVVACRGTPGACRRLGVTVATLTLSTGAALGYAWYAAGPVLANRAAFGFPRVDLVRYSAHWWSYLVPPVENPLMGGMARRVWSASGVREGLLEQQVSLGWGLLALALAAVAFWKIRPRTVPLAVVPVLAAVGVAAFLFSLPPDWTIAGWTFTAPSAYLHELAPMFRSYARFGVIVQLMAALLAGMAVDTLLGSGSSGARFACAALVVVTIAEYAVSPSGLWRDALPTRAHRWAARQPEPIRALDCAQLTQESASIQWLSGERVALAGGAVADCSEPDLPQTLAANGFTHLIVRRGTADSPRFADLAPPAGLQLAARFSDSRVFSVTVPPPAVYTMSMAGFFTRERDGLRSWRWMGGDAAWTIVNTRRQSIAAMLDVELAAFLRSRRMDVLLDGQCIQTLTVAIVSQPYRIGPVTMAAGAHEIVFHPADPPTAAGPTSIGDPRRLSFALGPWTWSADAEAR